jgi:hypothetical protein
VRALFLRLARGIALVSLMPLVMASGCHRDRCVSVCEQRAKELHCPPSESCKETCDRMHTVRSCAKEYSAYERCFLDLPASQWQCYVNQQPIPDPAACPAQRHDLETCLSGETPPSTPGATPH